MVVGELVQEKELVIIGGGPGGYTAAIRAAQLGRQVTLIEKDELGGICLNHGCIPSKVYTHAAKEISKLSHLQDIGIGFEQAGPAIQLNTLIAYKNRVTNQLKNGVAALCKANKIEVVKGVATFLSDDRIGVEAGHDFQTFQFKQAIIAAGGTPVAPKGVTPDDERIILSHKIFSLQDVPKHLVVLGGDVIALELAMTFRAFGAEVSILLEKGTDFPFDATITKELKRLCKKKKIVLQTDCEFKVVEATEDAVHVHFTNKLGEDSTILGSHFYTTGDISVNATELGIDRLGIERTAAGRVKINEQLQTNISPIYAIGDLTPGPTLAVKAIKQGKVAAEIITGGKSEVDLSLLPTVVHTIPPISTAGLTEAEAKELGYTVNVSQFPLGSNGYASIVGQKEGFVKIVADEATDLILGVHIIGEGAVELSGMTTIALELVARDEDFTFPHYAHPSVNESILEAVEGLVGRAIHMAPKKDLVRTK